MIEELKVSGFRSLKDVTWRPGRLNVVIGPNGSGKSNLLRALELVQFSSKGDLSGFIDSEGGMPSLLWDGQAKVVSISLATSSEDSYYLGMNSCSYTFSFLTGYENSHFINSEILFENIIENKHIKGTLLHINRDYRSSNVLIYDPFDEGVHSKPLIKSKSIDSETTLSQFTGFVGDSNGVAEGLRRSIEGWAVYPIVYIGKDSNIRKSFSARVDQRVASDGSNTLNVLHTLYSSDREFKARVNLAMRAAFGEDYDELIFPPAADQRIQMRIRWKSLKKEQSAVDLSDGTLRFLLLITILAVPAPPPLIVIDEPETGLHPSMLPLVAELAVNASLRSQVIFTTHSDQFLDAFMETWEKPTVTVAKWENGETALSVVDGEELKNWLEDYSLGTLYRRGELESGLIG